MLVGGKNPKKRGETKRDWNSEKEEIYVQTLAETCNYTAAAASAGVSVSSALRRRKTHAKFRASCRDAVAFAYERLELAMLDRGLNGSEKIVIRKDGSEERIREYPNAVALTLLRLHREGATEAMNEPDPGDVEELRERLFNKLERLRKREEARDQQE
ncbi:MAG: hypothetical protein HOP95_09195 [Sphingomonas sp.]|nr:hypothetical protein [Sphingomonas sp.]